MDTEAIEDRIRHGVPLEQIATEHLADPLDFDTEICYDFLLTSKRYISGDINVV